MGWKIEGKMNQKKYKERAKRDWQGNLLSGVSMKTKKI